MPFSEIGRRRAHNRDHHPNPLGRMGCLECPAATIDFVRLRYAARGGAEAGGAWAVRSYRQRLPLLCISALVVLDTGI